jgi:hypothetical protein
LLEDPQLWTSPSPSTGAWAKTHPRVFNIRVPKDNNGYEVNPIDIDYSIKLLKQAYDYVKGKQSRSKF